MKSSTILAKLAGGDRRSIGRSEEVVEDILRDPSKFKSLFAAMSCDDPLIRMRAADAAEKITAVHPEYLRPYKQYLINRIAQINQQEVRWHVAQMFPRLHWTAGERKRVVRTLMTYLEDESRIVKTFAVQSLVDLARHDPELMATVMPLVRKLTTTGTPAMQARGRKLMRELVVRRSVRLKVS